MIGLGMGGLAVKYLGCPSDRNELEKTRCPHVQRVKVDSPTKKKLRSTEDGESLASCSDKEWDVADPAYGSELINLKKKPHKVTVFAAPRGKTIERTKIIKAEARPEVVEDNADAIGRLCAAIARIYLQDKRPSDVEVEINLRVNRDHVENIDTTLNTSPAVR
ncbi:Uncharacterized protein C02F5.10 [Toxocara canis]|uniref:Uncharacterized protein C02F5.10 n=1 Tax=Toxocara canis TaxID=6265 RepID=A0A0B2UT57_TOXCA|nr:Uncharacterized protein C02F5.10 [Toxocara canis]